MVGPGMNSRPATPHRIHRSLPWLCLVLLLLPGAAVAAQASLAHAVVVIVNGQPITAAEIDQAARFILRSRHKGPGQPDVDRILAELGPEQISQLDALARNELIRVTLIHQGAKSHDLAPSWEEVQRGLRQSGYETPLLAPPMARRFIEAELLVDRIILAEGRPPYRPSPREVLDFWNRYKDTVFVEQREVRMRHIFLDVYGRDPWEVKEEMEELRQQVLATPPGARAEVFAELARKHSDGRFANQGGGGLLRIGTNEEGWFVQDFVNKKPDGTPVFYEPMYIGIRALVKKGEVSPVIRSPMGYHLLFLDDVRGGEQREFKTEQQSIRQLLRSRERQRRKNEWLRSAARSAAITWNDGSDYPVEELDPPAGDEPVL